MEILGIDVGRHEMHAVLLQQDRSTSKSVVNSAAGFKQLQSWLRNRKVEKVHACLETTGGWSEDLALVLHEAGHVVSLVNPTRIKSFARSEMLRTKTDLIDAALSVVKVSIEATLTHLDREIERVDHEVEQLFKEYPPLRRQRDLLTSIPGIGETTAARILGEMPNIAEFRNVKAVAAYAGLSPRHYESGSIRRPRRIAKTGNANLRTAPYCPAISAMRYNPLLRCFADRLRERRKSNMAIITAVMRKLLTRAYGVLKSGKLFDPTYASP